MRQSHTNPMGGTTHTTTTVTDILCDGLKLFVLVLIIAAPMAVSCVWCTTAYRHHGGMIQPSLIRLRLNDPIYNKTNASQFLINTSTSISASISSTSTNNSETPKTWNQAYKQADVLQTKVLWDAGGIDYDYVNTVINMTANMERKKLVKILEIGCGNGDNVIFLQKHGCDTYCLDIASIPLSKIPSGIHTFHGDITDSNLLLPNEWKNFDFIMMRSVMYHQNQRNKLAILKKIVKLLSTNGIVIDKEYDAQANQQKSILYNKKLRKEQIPLGPTYSITSSEMLTMYKKEGFINKHSLTHRAKCMTPFLFKNHFVWCIKMVLQKKRKDLLQLL